MFHLFLNWKMLTALMIGLALTVFGIIENQSTPPHHTAKQREAIRSLQNVNPDKNLTLK